MYKCHWKSMQCLIAPRSQRDISWETVTSPNPPYWPQTLCNIMAAYPDGSCTSAGACMSSTACKTLTLLSSSASVREKLVKKGRRRKGLQLQAASTAHIPIVHVSDPSSLSPFACSVCPTLKSPQVKPVSWHIFAYVLYCEVNATVSLLTLLYRNNSELATTSKSNFGEEKEQQQEKSD